MGFEHERKYLVETNEFIDFIKSNKISRNERLINKTIIKQAYLNHSGEWITTISKEGDLSLKCKLKKLTVKYKISKCDAKQLIKHPTTKYFSPGVWVLPTTTWASRIRIYNNSKAEICIKERIAGSVRVECEIESTLENAMILFNSVNERTHKTRHLIIAYGYKWEVDLFHDLNEGLCVAELETIDKDYPLLSFIKKEITEKKKYYNDQLSITPYSEWPNN
jgi:adenylate cyclase